MLVMIAVDLLPRQRLEKDIFCEHSFAYVSYSSKDEDYILYVQEQNPAKLKDLAIVPISKEKEYIKYLFFSITQVSSSCRTP